MKKFISVQPNNFSTSIYLNVDAIVSFYEGDDCDTTTVHLVQNGVFDTFELPMSPEDLLNLMNGIE